jgi:hypothetical protein
LSNIPQTRNVLIQHVNRTTYQRGHVWGKVLLASLPLPSPPDGGRTKDECCWIPVWTTLQEQVGDWWNVLVHRTVLDHVHEKTCHVLIYVLVVRNVPKNTNPVHYFLFVYGFQIGFYVFQNLYIPNIMQCVKRFHKSSHCVLLTVKFYWHQ